MTTADVVNEITYRCGEGYQQFSDRAKSAFWSAIASSLYSPVLRSDDAPGAFRYGLYTPLIAADKIKLSSLITAAGLSEGHLRRLRYRPGVQAALKRAPILYTAVTAGPAGNKISIAYEHIVEPNQDLSVAITQELDWTRIVFTLATDENGDIECTANDLVAFIPTSEAADYVTAEIIPGETGDGGLEVMDANELRGGGWDEGAAFIECERLTHDQYLAYLQNPDVLLTKDELMFYYLDGAGTDSQIELVIGSVESGAVLEYVLVGWNETWLDSNSTVISDLFSPKYLEALISTAANILLKEIRL